MACASDADPASGRDPAQEAARERFFEREVRPLLAEHCYSCHGPTKQKGGLRLDSGPAVLHGGESGPVLVPGKPEDSLLVDAVNHVGLEMPPVGKLEPTQIAVLTRWVAMGAPWPAGSVTPAITGKVIRDEDRAFWAFRPLGSPRVPEPRASTSSASTPSDWPRTAIDRFILAGQLERGLTPTIEADRRTLIRRASFDLIGLPPTPEEIDAFVADPAPDAYERLVDRLLASPRYGQHWARHWLDLVRYAESDGHRQDAYRPEAWRYRDYVVASFNADKPYDRFLAEQIAGDEIDGQDPELRVATGYLRLGTYEFNQRNVRGQWSDILNDITDVTGEVFLGLSLGCARCHDHKFDPILQADYYRLQAFFTPLLPRDDLIAAPAADVPADRGIRLASWERATAEARSRLEAIERPYRMRAADGAIAKFPEEIKDILRKAEGERTPLERQIAALANRQVALEYEKEPTVSGAEKSTCSRLRERLKASETGKPAALPMALAATDVGPVAPPTTIPGDRMARTFEPGFPAVLDPSPARVDAVGSPPVSTGRRLALARWLGRPDNPLSTRVIVNRVWQYHFGRGLVATSNDFGKLGERPSHPELLDWLARRLVADGWRLKPLHRLIMTSTVYRQAAQRPESEDEDGNRIDPENRLLWKRTVRRLDAEQIRDAMLLVAGDLLASTIGGPAVAGDRPRRAIDTRVVRNSRDPLLDVFDAPDGYSSTGLRNTTTTATQALLLINGPWSLGRARGFAHRLERAESDDGRIRLAYRLAFGREAEPDELFRARAFLARQSAHASPEAGRSGRQEAFTDLCHAILNSNEFLYID